MDLALGTAGTAWMTAAMLLTQASLGLFRAKGGLLRGSHIALGAILLPVTFVHAWVSMKSVSMKSANMLGLWFATVALLLLGVQLLLGTALMRASQRSVSFKRIHLAVGLSIVSLVSLHVLLIR